MFIAWMVALTFLAFVGGWFVAGLLHMGRAEDIYREGFSKGQQEAAKTESPLPRASNWS